VGFILLNPVNLYNCWLLLDNGTSAQSLSEFFPVQAFFRRDQSQSIG
jgi:hypothetical protein